jgi:hypothetical protein
LVRLSSALHPCLVGLDLHREEGAGSNRYQIRGVRTDHREGEEQGAAWTRERRRGVGRAREEQNLVLVAAGYVRSRERTENWLNT